MSSNACCMQMHACMHACACTVRTAVMGALMQHSASTGVHHWSERYWYTHVFTHNLLPRPPPAHLTLQAIRLAALGVVDVKLTVQSEEGLKHLSYLQQARAPRPARPACTASLSLPLPNHNCSCLIADVYIYMCSTALHCAQALHTCIHRVHPHTTVQAQACKPCAFRCRTYRD